MTILVVRFGLGQADLMTRKRESVLPPLPKDYRLSRVVGGRTLSLFKCMGQKYIKKHTNKQFI